MSAVDIEIEWTAAFPDHAQEMLFALFFQYACRVDLITNPRE